jgi:hypothetical protein
LPYSYKAEWKWKVNRAEARKPVFFFPHLWQPVEKLEPMGKKERLVPVSKEAPTAGEQAAEESRCLNAVRVSSGQSQNVSDQAKRWKRHQPAFPMI